MKLFQSIFLFWLWTCILCSCLEFSLWENVSFQLCLLFNIPKINVNFKTTVIGTTCCELGEVAIKFLHKKNVLKLFRLQWTEGIVWICCQFLQTIKLYWNLKSLFPHLKVFQTVNLCLQTMTLHWEIRAGLWLSPDECMVLAILKK